VTDPLQPGDFTTVKPLPDNIGICRQLKEQGHVIIIHTGRAMGIHSGNVGMVLKDIAKLTFDQLDEFGIPYDEIYFGKPHADVYIDGKSVNPTTEFAKTLGSLVESEEAKQPKSAPGSPSSKKADDTDNDPSQYEMVEARHFNSLQFRPGSVCKYSPYHVLDGEAYWYQNAPLAAQKFIPALVALKIQPDTTSFIELERLKGPTLCHLYTNCCMTPNTLREHLQTLDAIHECDANEDFAIDILQNYIPKIHSRCKTSRETYESCCEGWEAVRDTIVQGLEAYAASGLAKEGVIHGDPVFSNVIATQSDGLKLVDMRGKQGDVLTLRGDVMYDYAKVYQSVCGYDFVLLDRPRCNAYIDAMRSVADHEMSERLGAEGLRYLRIVTASLYFSLIPLHEEPAKMTKYFELCKDVLRLAT
jgi:capsule biosynthesis phosphatase